MREVSPICSIYKKIKIGFMFFVLYYNSKKYVLIVLKKIQKKKYVLTKLYY